MSDSSHDFGPINGHLISTAMKTMVGRAIGIIRRRFYEAKAEFKVGDDGMMNNAVTTADLEVQAFYHRAITEGFPTFGIVAEEGKVNKPCTFPDHDIWFTVDAIDGTRAFIRQASHGIGTMVSLVYDGEVVGACIGDATTEEIYGYRPGSNTVHRISFLEHVETLSAEPGTGPFTGQVVLLRDPVALHSVFIQRLVHLSGIFREQEIVRGSIGLSMARLWKKEVGAVILRPGSQKPWDCVPFVGISRKLGFVFLKVDASAGQLVSFDFLVIKEAFTTDHEIIVVHGGRVEELLAALPA